MENVSFDYIVVGAGAAGLASAQYASRGGLKTVVIDISDAGGQALQIAQLENYPGVYPSVTGRELADAMRAQAESFGVKIIQAHVLALDKIGVLFHVHTKDSEYTAPAMLIATGAEHKMLGVPGEKEFTGSGVSYCAVCDGPFFKDKNIVVVGGGDSACTEALYLSTLSSRVLLVHRRRQLRTQKTIAERLHDESNITVRYNTVVREIRGEGHVQSVLLEDTQTAEQVELPADAVFIFVGMTPQTDLVSMLPRDEEGYVKTDENMETIIKGLYCAGDVRSKPFRQIVTAASDGAVAAHQAELYVHSLGDYSGDTK